MTSSQTMSSTQKRSRPARIDDHEFEYHRQRLKNRIFEEVLHAFVDKFEKDGFNKADLANVTGRHPSMVTRWLSGPKNWTIDTISDILLAIGSELQLRVVSYDEKPPPNRFHPLAPPALENKTERKNAIIITDKNFENKSTTSSSNRFELLKNE